MKKKIMAVILLVLLVVVPFLDWRLGAVLWMSAWLTFIFQKLFSRKDWNLGEDRDQNLNDDNND